MLNYSAVNQAARSDVSAIIPTSRRPSVLTDTILSLLSQSAPPRRIVVIASEPDDVETCIKENSKVTVLLNPGSAAQKRNVALRYADGKYVLFADDDVEFHPAYLAEAIALMDEFPAIVAFSGKLLKNGDISREEARELIRGWRPKEHWRGRLRVDRRFPQLHGCNMIIRRTVLMRETFDETLPAYSLGEDYDLWVRVKRYGLTGTYDCCIAVHLKASGGRLTPRKMAYSHLANHWHFLSKGVSSLPHPWSYLRFLALCIKLPLLSLTRMRQGSGARSVAELHGYAIAIGDIVSGRSRPSRISEIRN